MTDSLDHIWNSLIQQCSLKTCHLFQIYVASALIATTEAKLSRVCHQRLCLFPHNAITVYKYIQTASLWLVRSTVLAENRYIHGPPRPPYNLRMYQTYVSVVMSLSYPSKPILVSGSFSGQRLWALRRSVTVLFERIHSPDLCADDWALHNCMNMFSVVSYGRWRRGKKDIVQQLHPSNLVRKSRISFPACLWL